VIDTRAACTSIALAVSLCVVVIDAGQRGSASASVPPFVDVTEQSGLDFVHVNGARGQLLLPEVIGSGGALFDFDNDGDLDLFLVQGAATDKSGGSATSRLFRNDTGRGDVRTFHFTDVTERSGGGVIGSGMGVAAGDFDNDGWIDLYVTALGSNHLLRNNGDGTFTDVTAKTRTDDPRWSTSATFFDYDNDGRLDLYVANYVRFSAGMKRECYSAASARDYCNPVVYDPVPDSLFHNEGNGTFTDVSARAGIARAAARGLGVLAADVNGDGWTDLYVANDGDQNQLWINKNGSGAFEDDALLRGVAVDRMGRAQGSMGIDAADVDADGDDDLFVTNLDNEANTFYRNQGRGVFEDRTSEAGLFRLGFTGFGTRFVDYDNDGWLDLIVINGAVRQLGSQVRAGDPYPLRQRSALFHSERGRRFVDVTEAAGDAFAPLQVGRGLLAGDLDNDGDIDLVMVNNNGPARVLRNDAGSRRHWLGVRVVDARYRRDAMQARVQLASGDGRQVVRRVHTDGSYCSSSDPRIVFGLADNASAQTVRIEWPGGGAEEFRNLAVDRYWLLERGKPPRLAGGS
jgi:enediyne biosynthesis protein E4